MLVGIVYGISTLFTDQKEPPFPFEANLIRLDTNTISSIEVFLKSEAFEKITFQKESSEWLITKNNFTTKANVDSIEQLLSTIQNIQTDRIVANQRNQWEKFGVQDRHSNQVKIYENGMLKEDFHITTSLFTQTNIDTAFIRLSTENEVYAVPSMVGHYIDKGFSSYRKRNILNVPIQDLIQVEFMNNTSLDTILRNNEHWTWNGSILDSTKITNYINGLQQVSGFNFVNDFDALDNQKRLHHQIKLTCSNQPEPILIRCYTDTLRAKPFIIHSNMNKDAYFASDSTEIYQRLFKKVGDFIK